MTPAEHANAIEDAIVEYGEACIGNALQPSRETKARCLRAHRALRAATRAGVGAEPEGWRLVPVEPIHAMLAAAAITRAEYSAMLAAAPKP